jgi:hypothetical protein
VATRICKQQGVEADLLGQMSGMGVLEGSAAADTSVNSYQAKQVLEFYRSF